MKINPKTTGVKIILSTLLGLIIPAFFFSCFTGGCTSNSNNPGSPSDTVQCKGTTYMFKTTDGGNSWNPISVRGANKLKKITSDLAIGRNSDGDVLLRFDGNNNTVCLPTATNVNGGYMTDIEFIDGKIWISYLTALYVRSSDYGVHWDITSLNNGFNIYDIEYSGGYVFLAGSLGGTGAVLRSTDLGQTWDTTLAGSVGIITDLQFINDFGTGYVINDRGWVDITVDFGATWSQGIFTGYGNFNATCSDETGGTTYQVIVSNLGLILRSSTAAATWELVNQPAGAANLMDVATNGSKWFAVGGNEIWTGDINANNWTKTVKTGNFSFQDITFIDANTGYIVGY